LLHDIPSRVMARMDELVEMDARHRAGEMMHFDRLRQVPPETGRFLALISSTAPDGKHIEIGTSGGYSGLWLSLACRALGRTLTTFELSETKVALATETFEAAGVDDIVTIVPGDVRGHLGEQTGVSFCFLDTEKPLYAECYETVVPNMVSGGLLAADNVTSHAEVLESFLARVENDERVDSMIVPVGSGVLLVRKV
jgi:caffeoyl-CoA O-methyltransferase